MANQEKYDVTSSDSDSQYKFISVGIKGSIIKRVQFLEIDESEKIYNCAFGDWEEATMNINDMNDSNNGDLSKVLATVIGIIYDFTYLYPERAVFITGSTSIRTALYGRIIHNNYSELKEDFSIFGVKTGADRKMRLVPFTDWERNNYNGFLVKRINWNKI